MMREKVRRQFEGQNPWVANLSGRRNHDIGERDNDWLKASKNRLSDTIFSGMVLLEEETYANGLEVGGGGGEQLHSQAMDEVSIGEEDHSPLGGEMNADTVGNFRPEVIRPKN